MKRVDFAAVHGRLEDPVARKLLRHAGLECGAVKIFDAEKEFWERARQYRKSAQAGLVIFCLTDLERRPCAPGLLRESLPAAGPNLIVRVAVRMLESWLMADKETMARFLGAPLGKLPDRPDTVEHPKKLLVQLARNHSGKDLRADLVPAEGTSGIVGGAISPA